MDYKLLWAKSDPYHPLWAHLLDVAAVCTSLIPRFGGVPPLSAPWLAYLVGPHDIGKADGMFQNKDAVLAAALVAAGLPLPPPEPGFRHEARSAEWLMGALRDLGWGRGAYRVVAQAIRAHHGDFGADAYCEDDYPSRVRLWPPLRESLAAMLRDVLHPGDLAIQQFEHASAAGIRLSGVIVLSDWIASNDDIYHYPRLPKDSGPHSYYAAACQEASRAVGSLGLGDPNRPSDHSAPRFAEIWPACKVLRPSQSALEEACRSGVEPGLAIIEAPMGEGKTEGGIYLSEYWARTAGRLGAYIALPTAATSNQMHDRYASFLAQRRPDEDPPRLVHGMAWLVDEETPRYGSKTFGGEGAGGAGERLRSREWFSPTKRALLASEGVGTVDQALMAALNVKHGFLRLFGLSSKVLIIDEVHAYDEYMTVLMERLLQWCRALEIPVILLSATLSYAQKRRLAEAYRGSGALPPKPAEGEPYPLITLIPIEGETRLVGVPGDPARRQTVRIQSHDGLLGDAAGTAELAASLVKDGGCVCVLVNTVGAAQAVFRLLSDNPPADTELFLFHARFRACKRQEIEKRVLGLFGKDTTADSTPRRPVRAILVATQVVEQSLDVDFDVMITEVAPVDLLLQRSGRVHRHAGRNRHGHRCSTLHVLAPPQGSLDFGGSGRVYAQEILIRTLDVIDGRTAFNLPEDFRPLIERCYGSGPVKTNVATAEKLQKAVDRRGSDLSKARAEAHTHLIPTPCIDEFSLAQNADSAVEEADENATASYFHARTRLGDATLSILVLENAEDLAVARSEIPPPRERMRKFMLEIVSIPRWWLKDTEPEDPDLAKFDGKGWLRGRTVLPMRKGEWRGRKTVTCDGAVVTQSVSIQDDSVLGLLLKGGEQTDAQV